MKIYEDNSTFQYGIGSNPTGGGNIIVIPETPEEEKDAQEAGYPILLKKDVVGYIIECRLTKHIAGRPNDAGINPQFKEICIKYGLKTKKYDFLSKEG